jgi:hypothetical protein
MGITTHRLRACLPARQLALVLLTGIITRLMGITTHLLRACLLHVF